MALQQMFVDQGDDRGAMLAVAEIVDDANDVLQLDREGFLGQVVVDPQASQEQLVNVAVHAAVILQRLMGWTTMGARPELMLAESTMLAWGLSGTGGTEVDL